MYSLWGRNAADIYVLDIHRDERTVCDGTQNTTPETAVKTSQYSSSSSSGGSGSGGSSIAVHTPADRCGLIFVFGTIKKIRVYIQSIEFDSRSTSVTSHQPRTHVPPCVFLPAAGRGAEGAVPPMVCVRMTPEIFVLSSPLLLQLYMLYMLYMHCYCCLHRSSPSPSLFTSSPGFGGPDYLKVDFYGGPY